MPIHLGYIKNKVLDDQSNLTRELWTGIIKDVEMKFEQWNLKYYVPNESRIMKIVRKVSLHLFVSHIWIESTVNKSHWFIPWCIFCWLQQMLANIIISNSILLNTNNRYQSSIFVTSGRNKIRSEVTFSGLHDENGGWRKKLWGFFNELHRKLNWSLFGYTCIKIDENA